MNYINVLVSSLETQTESDLIEYLLLESCNSVNSEFILHTMGYIATTCHQTRKFCIAFRDATRYISLARKTLKELYSSLMHATCTAHFQHN